VTLGSERIAANPDASSTLGRFPYATLLAVIGQRLDWGIRQLIRRIRQQLACVIRRGLAGIDRWILIRVQTRQRHATIVGQTAFKRSSAHRQRPPAIQHPAAHADAHSRRQIRASDRFL
jgi:hypothetical protein